MGLRDKVKTRSIQIGLKVAGKVLKSPSSMDNIAKAADTLQKVRAHVDSGTENLLHLSHLPSKEDLSALNRQAGRLKRHNRKINALLEELESLI